MASDVTFDDEFLSFYSKLSKRENTFRIFNHNSYYTVHDDNAEYVCKNFLNTTESLKEFDKGNGKKFTFAWISQTRYSSLIRFLLIENSFIVEVYAKENPKSFTNKQWKLDCEASPGCLGQFENILYEDDVNISIQSCSVYINEDHMVYVASIDPISCIIYLGVFQDNDHLRQLESVLVISNPKECLIQDNHKTISQLLKKNQILERKYFTNDQIDEEVGQILNDLSLPQCKTLVEKILNQSSNRILIPLKHLLTKQKLLVSKMKGTNDEGTNKEIDYPFDCFFIKQFNPNKYVRLDLSSIQHLHLFPEKRDCKIKNSLFQLLNCCKTVCGMKLLEKFIRQPSLDKNTIENRLDIVEYFQKNPGFAMKIRELILPQVPDIAKLYKKLTTGHYTIKDIFNLYILLEQLRHLLKIFNDESKDLYPNALKKMIIVRLVKTISDTNNIYVKLAKALDLEQFNETGDLALNVQMFPSLTGLEERKKKILNEMKDEQKMLSSRYQIKISLEKSKEFGWFYRTEKKNQAKISEKYINQTIANEKEYKFNTKLLKEKNEDYSTWQRQFEKDSQKCIKSLLDNCHEELPKISTLESFVALLDVLLSFAKFACDSCIPLTKPIILSQGSNQIELIQFRHPILGLLKNENFVPNSIKFDESNKFYVVTGPNMGGKSTLLRSVAMCVLMAQIGSFVPCEKAIISLVDAIYTRISSSDNQSMGMSTFMTEMHETAGILESSTSDSLVLIDELGRSTATNDGFGLAQSVAEYISNEIKSYSLFATHFHNLGLRLPNVSRLQMQTSFNDNRLIIHYTAVPNPGNIIDSQSFGIEVMKCVGMPEHLIKKSEERLKKISYSIDETTLDKVMLLSESLPDNDNDLEKFVKNLEEIL